ncbi:hypothetical protein A2U01_0103704, partial [Trifolium medium]|nr:hypothetical protein [Trifolium medium]
MCLMMIMLLNLSWLIWIILRQMKTFNPHDKEGDYYHAGSNL